MATFTIELWRVLELYPSEDYSSIGLDDYPIFDEEYRSTLNQLIVNHYHNREIGQETVSMFKFAVKRRMHEVMPYYNELYRSQQMEFDPLRTISMRTVVTGEGTQTTESNSFSDSENASKTGSRAVTSNTPQVMLSGNKDYATSGADSTSESTGETSSNQVDSSVSNDESTSESETTGYQGNPAELIASYRRNLINVNLMVIDELADCFMLIWNNGDDYFRRKGMYYR